MHGRNEMTGREITTVQEASIHFEKEEAEFLLDLLEELVQTNKDDYFDYKMLGGTDKRQRSEFIKKDISIRVLKARIEIAFCDDIDTINEINVEVESHSNRVNEGGTIF